MVCLASGYPYDRYVGYLDNEDDRKRRKRRALFGAVAAGVAGVAATRYLISSGLAQQALDTWMPKLHAGALTLGRAPASRRAGETWPEAFIRSYREEYEHTETRPDAQIIDIMGQREQRYHDVDTTTRRTHVIGEIKGRYGSQTAKTFDAYLTERKLAMPTYLETAGEDLIRRDMTSLFGGSLADGITGAIMRGRQHAKMAPETRMGLDMVVAEELAQRRPSRVGGLMQRLLGIRPMTIGEYVAQHPDAAHAEEIKALGRMHPRMLESMADPGLMVSRDTGRTLDLRQARRFALGLLKDSSKTLPGKLLQTRLMYEAVQRPFLYRISPGDEQPFIMGDQRRSVEDLMLIGSRVVKTHEPAVTVAKDRTLLPNISTAARMARHMVGTEPSQVGDSVVGAAADKLHIRKLLDLGNQDQASVWDKLASASAKYDDPMSFPNVMQRALTGQTLNEAETEVFLKGVDKLSPHGFSEQVLGEIEGMLPSDWSFLRGKLRLRTEADAKRVLDLLHEQEDIESQLLGHTRRSMGIEKQAVRGEYIDEDYTRRTVSEALISKMGPHQLRRQIGQAQRQGRLSLAQAQKAYDVINRYIVRAAVPNRLTDNASDAINRLMQVEGPRADLLRAELADLTRRSVKTFTPGKTTVPQNLDAGRYMVVGKGTSLLDVFDVAKEGNIAIKAKQFAKQYAAGRRSLTDVTTRTFLPYYFPERVNEALTSVGLALGPDSMGSTLDLYKNLMLKRFLPAYAGAKYASYLGWEFGKLTGLTAQQRLARTRASLDVHRAGVKDRLGITQFQKRMQRSMPGIDVLGDVPFIGVPFREPRTREELIEWLKYGDEPVRQGAHWMLSGQPWRGGRVSYWRPNWFRMATSEYKMTDSLYGSAEEYWSHQVLPTPRYPLAPLRALTDPYWLENKHMKDRPYPISGPLVSEDYLFGPLVNMTAGLVIKPRRYYHQAEMKRARRQEKREAAERRRAASGRIQLLEGGDGYQAAFLPPSWSAGDAVAGAVAAGVPAGGTRTGRRAVTGLAVSRAAASMASMQSAWGAAIQSELSLAEKYARIAQRRSDQYRRFLGVQAGSSMGRKRGGGAAWRAAKASNRSIRALAIGKRPGKGVGGAVPGMRMRAAGGRGLGTGRAAPYVDVRLPKPGVLLKPARGRSYVSDIGVVESAFDAPPATTGLMPLKTTMAAQPMPRFSRNDLSYQMQAQARNMRTFMGAWGWGLEMMGGGERPRLLYADAGRMTSIGQAYADSNIGGTVLQMDSGAFGMAELAEMSRRFFTKRPAAVQEYNPIRNTMPEWLPGEGYMLDFRRGDPFRKIPLGEARLPGGGFKAAHPFYPDVDDSRYGWFTRYTILADVAPWSDEFKLYSRVVSQRRAMLPEELQSRASEIRKQVAERKKRYDLYPYRFVGSEQRVRRMKATVADFIGPSAFTIEEMPGEVFRTAGVKLSADEPLSQHLRIGQQVELAIPDDAFTTKRSRNKDIYGSISAGIYTGSGEMRRNLNAALLRSGAAKERPGDWSGPGVQTRFSPLERSTGRAWEKFAHLDIPFLHRKFLPVDSPLEYFERRQIYGKEFATWERPIADYLGPTIESHAQKNPLYSAALSAGTGAVLGATILGGPVATAYTALGGAALGAGASMTRGAAELVTRRKWVPARIKQKWRMDDYFDILKYMKYRGVYERAAHQAKLREGVNVQQEYKQVEGRRRGKQHVARIVKKMKRQAAIAGDKPSVATANLQLKRMQADRRLLERGGPWTRMAVMARKQYESTLYGADLSNPQSIMNALPAERREFYKHFAEERDKRKRKRILGMLSPLERRVYQHTWGMKVDPRPNLSAYFKKNKLPGRKWAGWHPAVDLQAVKARVVRNEGLNMHDYNLYAADMLKAQMAPGISRPFNPRSHIGSMRKNIQDVLRGFGLRNVRIDDMPIELPQIDVDLDIDLDYEDELDEQLRAGAWF